MLKFCGNVASSNRVNAKQLISIQQFPLKPSVKDTFDCVWSSVYHWHGKLSICSKPIQICYLKLRFKKKKKTIFQYDGWCEIEWNFSLLWVHQCVQRSFWLGTNWNDTTNSNTCKGFVFWGGFLNTQMWWASGWRVCVKVTESRTLWKGKKKKILSFFH